MKWFLRRAAAMIPVVALAAAAVGSAVAQVQRPMTVAVLNFSNSSGWGGALLGNRAAAAVEAQMIESGRYDVVKRELVVRTMEDLNLSFPLGRLGLTQLATRLEADAVATGDVLRVVRDAKTSQVRVTLRVELTDRTSGELVNGAISTGESGIRPDLSGSEDVLLDEALNRASFSSVRTMNERILPEGTIFATSSSEGNLEALMNIGSNSGVRPGMEFIVLRNREQVGRLRASRVSSTDSTAIVIASTRGVQPEDKVRAVFRLENIPVDLGGTGTSESRISRPKMKLSNLAIGALALFGLYKVSQGRLGTGTPGARQPTAVATGPNNGAPGANAFPFVPVIRVSWSSPVGVAAQDIIGYGVYRLTTTGAGRPIDIISGSTPRYSLDDGFARGGDEDTGDDSDAEFGEGNVNGLSSGVTERYMIRTAYWENTDDGDGTGGGTGGTDDGDVAYADEVISNSATALLPPAALRFEQADTTDAARINFTFTRVPGGDRYVLEVADNPGFTNADRYPRSGQELIYAPPPPYGPSQYWADVEEVEGGGFTCTPNTEGDDTCTLPDPRELDDPTNVYAPPTTVLVDLNTGRLDPPSPGRQLYWRVGVRSSRDDRRPENGGYVWGDATPLSTTTTTATTMTVKKPTKIVDPTDPPVVDGPTHNPSDPIPGGFRPGSGRNRRAR